MRVWQDVNDARDIYISARPADGSWRTLGTIPLPLDDGMSSSGRFRYGDIQMAVPLGNETEAGVEVRVWQDVRNALRIYISARPADGSWATLGTIPLPLDDGVSSSGRFRYGDISLEVLLAAGEPAYAAIPIPSIAVEFEDGFTAAERAEFGAELRKEFRSVATFFARRYGITVEGLTIQLMPYSEENARRQGYANKRIWLAESLPDIVSEDEHGNRWGISGDRLEFVNTVAHEYVHAMQDELAADSYTPHWLAEGMAVFFEYLYFHDSGHRTHSESRVLSLWAAKLEKGTLESMETYVITPQRHAVPFLAAEWLAEHAGEDALFDFYRRYEASPSWRVAFAEAFGLTINDFYETFAPYRAEVAPEQTFFRGIVLGPDGEPVEGIMVTAFRPGSIFSWANKTGADGRFSVLAESGVTMFHDSGPTWLTVGDDRCGPVGFVDKDGRIVRSRSAAREFVVDITSITGIVVRLDSLRLCKPGEELRWSAQDN